MVKVDMERHASQGAGSMVLVVRLVRVWLHNFLAG
jgi:hypothetical protein